MPQPPFLVDAVQIEPGSGDTLTLSRDSTDGALKFVDAVLTGGVLLPSLVGLRNITGVFIVGRAGDGAVYTSVQDALDAVPASSSAAAPSLILVMPGVYVENLTVERDGVYLVGLGGVTLRNTGANDTVEISASQDATPLAVLLKGLRIENAQDGQACVRVLGADTFATGTVTVAAAPLTLGDQVEVGGVTLTGVVGARTSGANDFSVSGGTATAIAAEIAAAINDSANGFPAIVTASPSGADVNLTAVTAGTAGNTITLSVTVSNPGDMTVSGATLSGGSAAGSLVGSGGIVIEGCEIVASGNGGYQVYADTSNYIDVRGGTWRGSSSTSAALAVNCARFSVSGTEWVNDFQLSYVTTADRPSDTTCEYLLSGINRANEVLSNLSGEGSLSIGRCPQFDTGVSQDGDQTLTVLYSSVGDLVLGGTTAATLTASTRSSATAAGGTPTLAESKIVDALAFAATAVETYSFDVTQPDTSYTVLLENPSTAVTLAVTNKTTSGFDVESSGVLTGTVGLTIVRAQ